MRRGFRIGTCILVIAQVAVIAFLATRLETSPHQKQFTGLCREEAQFFTTAADEYEHLADKLEARYGPRDFAVTLLRGKIKEYRRKCALSERAAHLDWQAIDQREADNYNSALQTFNQSINNYAGAQQRRLTATP